MLFWLVYCVPCTVLLGIPYKDLHPYSSCLRMIVSWGNSLKWSFLGDFMLIWLWLKFRISARLNAWWTKTEPWGENAESTVDSLPHHRATPLWTWIVVWVLIRSAHGSVLIHWPDQKWHEQQTLCVSQRPAPVSTLHHVNSQKCE